MHFICGLICFCVFTLRQDSAFNCDRDEAVAADSGMNRQYLECARMYKVAKNLQADVLLNEAFASMFSNEPRVSQLMQSLVCFLFISFVISRPARSCTLLKR